MGQHEQMRRELLIDQAIRKQLDAVVSQANTRVSVLGNSKMEESQFRNVLNVAMESHSIKVVVNFIRYQIARLDSAWGHSDFGDGVIFDLSGISQNNRGSVTCIINERTERALEWAREEIETNAESQIALEQDAAKHATIQQQRDNDIQAINAMRDKVAVRLMQLYLGYLGRAFYYAKKTNSFERLREVANV